MGRKTKRVRGIIDGRIWANTLKVRKIDSMPSNYGGYWLKVFKRRRPLKRNKYTRREYDEGFRQGFREDRKV